MPTVHGGDGNMNPRIFQLGLLANLFPIGGGRWDPLGGPRFQATPDGVRIDAVWRGE
jgi:hypothetical protein